MLTRKGTTCYLNIKVLRWRRINNQWPNLGINFMTLILGQDTRYSSKGICITVKEQRINRRKPERAHARPILSALLSMSIHSKRSKNFLSLPPSPLSFEVRTYGTYAMSVSRVQKGVTNPMTSWPKVRSWKQRQREICPYFLQSYW